MTSPTIPIVYDELKQCLRSGLTSDARKYWWPYLPLIAEGSTIDSYPDISEISAKLLSIIGISNFDLSSTLLSDLLYRKNVIADPILAKDVESILSLTIDDATINYYLLSHLFNNTHGKYLSHTIDSVCRRVNAFRILLSHYMPKTHKVLNDIGALDSKFLNMIFVGYFKLILPVQVIERITDCFLLEGVKILFRYGLAIIKMHKTNIKSNRFSTGIEFWDHVTTYYTDDERIRTLHHCAYDRDRNGLEKVRRPMNIGRNNIQSILNNTSSNSALDRTQSIYIPSHLSSKEAPMSSFMDMSVDRNDDFVFDLSSVSSLLNKKSAMTLSSYLSEITKLIEFRKVFSSSIDGYNLSSLYSKCKGCKPCIILIRPSREHGSCIIGAYISTSIESSSSSDVSGDGNTFVFKIDDDGCGFVYRWIGLNDNADQARYSSDVSYSSFAMFRDSYLSFGSSSGYSNPSNAIRVDHHFSKCYFGPSVTYDNPPMINDGEMVDIQALEVLCGPW